VRTVLEDESYRSAALKLQASIQQTDGLELAADLVEEAFKIGREMLPQTKASLVAGFPSLDQALK
jgi:hypothetical protein